MLPLPYPIGNPLLITNISILITAFKLIHIDQFNTRPMMLSSGHTAYSK